MTPRDELSTRSHAPAPGRMTAVMRAASLRANTTSAAGDRVLRIGIVKDGRVVEERIVKNRASVIVGPGEDATFVLPLARAHRLFEKDGDGYVLNFLPEMTGRIALEDGISSI